MKNLDINHITQLRHKIHQNPCLSNHEEITANFIVEDIKKYNPDKLYTNVAGAGIVAIFKGKKRGPAVLVRSELDALPIVEKSGVPYSSCVEGVAHSCGHDGHMAILCGLAQLFGNERDKYLPTGSLILVWQPAEEIGTGGDAMIEALKKMGIKYDYSVGIHNSPGDKKRAVVSFPKYYSWASVGIKIEISGFCSHASTPWLAANPTDLLINMYKRIHSLDAKLRYSTCVKFIVGEENYGITPGEGSLALTARAQRDDLLDTLVEKIKKIAKETLDLENKKRGKRDFSMKISFHDYFPATINDTKLSKVFEGVAKELGFEIITNREGTLASDDFTYYTRYAKALFFELGNGVNFPPLHDPKFDFPDFLIPDGIKLIATYFLRLQQMK